MRILVALLSLIVLAACGMKGDLYEPPAPAGPGSSETAPAPESGTTDKGERRQIPATPDPDRSL